jgi:GNAT superfamily N-acetyltransferase
MFHVEKMRTADFPFAVKLANTMNWNMAEEDFEFNLNLEPRGCFVLFDDSNPIGVATSISFGRVGWFGNLVVSEDCRKEGAGTLLVKHAVDYLENVGVETIGLHAYQHLVGFYGKLGFKPDVDFSVLHGKSAGCIAETTAREISQKEVPALVEFDRGCFGADRKKLLEPIILDENNQCYVSADGDEITGYVATKVYDEMAEVGPLVTRRNSVGVATSLLRTVLGRLGNREAFVCLPVAEKALLKILSESGFKEKFRVTRMFLGPAVAKSCIYVAESLERG